MPGSSGARPWRNASRLVPAHRRPIWSSGWTSTGTVWWWECNDIKTAGTESALNQWTRNEQETAHTSGEAPYGGARPRDEGVGLLRRVLQRDAAILRRRSLLLFVSHGGPGNRRHGAGEAIS